MKHPTDASAKRLNVPCGRCGACRATRRNDWTFRLAQEAKDHIHTQFITLTYRDEDLPIVDNPSGPAPSLVREDFTLFLKRLRKQQTKYTNKKIRYYAVGEYGTETARPHYHIIAFSIHPRNTHNIDQIWPFGHFHHVPLEPALIHYITKHHVNTKDNNVYHGEHHEPEFSTQSRMPGIGHAYIEKNKQWHIDNKHFHVLFNGRKQRLPRYYRDKIFSKHEQRLHAVKIQSQQSEDYAREYERLKRLNIKYPDQNYADDFDQYMSESKFIDSKKIIDKAKEGNFF